MSHGKHRRQIARAERARAAVRDSAAVAGTTAVMVVLGIAVASEAAVVQHANAAELPSGASHTASSGSAAIAEGAKLLKASHGGASWTADDVTGWLRAHGLTPVTLANELAARGIGQSQLPSAVRDVLASAAPTSTTPTVAASHAASKVAPHVVRSTTKPRPHTASTTPSPATSTRSATATPTPTATATHSAPVKAAAAATTSKPSITAAPSQQPAVIAKPAGLAGHPGASNTGVPAGTSLRSSGGMDITTPGTVIDGLDISGCVTIDAPNVSIKNSRIHCSTSASVVSVNSGNVTISHSEIEGQGAAAQCVSYSNYTLDAVDIHGCADGAKFASNVVIRNSYIHDLARGSGTHNDALQTMGGHDDVIEGNTLLAYSAAQDDPMNAALHSGHITSDLRNVRVSNNYMDGGNYTVNAGATTAGGHSISDYVFTNNVFGPDSRYGAVTSLGGGVSFDSSNVWASNGQPVH